MALEIREEKINNLSQSFAGFCEKITKNIDEFKKEAQKSLEKFND